MSRSLLPGLCGVVLIRAAAAVISLGVAPEPWPLLHHGAWTGPAQPSSPDPLVQFQFDAGTNDTVLQIFPVAAAAVGPALGTSQDAFINTSSAVGSTTCNITVQGSGTLVIDFGLEMAAWFEFDASNLLPSDAGAVSLGISEYNVIDYVGSFKSGRPVKYCNGSTCTYRLETNSELYEGVRYGFLVLSAAPSTPFTISGLRAVAQAKAVNYTGAFSSPGDPEIERAWYTAAYTVRATLQSTYMGSILVDRGDRYSWTGDAYPTQATSMAAFGNFPFVFNNLNRTKSDCQGIATYCLYFVLSCGDYLLASGDIPGVAYLSPDVAQHLNDSIAMWQNPQGLRFVGWDDRTGSGFANNTTPETQAMYRLIAIRALRVGVALFNATGNPALSTYYAAQAENFTAAIRGMGASPWYGEFGLHAGADAVNAGFLNAAEQAGIAAGAIGDPVKLPSQSNFNQYFILHALAGLGQLDRGVESIRLVWGPILSLGATTFWETSHPSAASIMPPGPPAPANEQSGWVSLCHPWSSGPAPWLSTWVLGIRPTAPGFGRALVAPHLTHGMATAGVSGGVPTPHGRMSVSVSSAPAGCAVISLDNPPEGVHAVTLRLSAVLLARLGIVAAELLTSSQASAASLSQAQLTVELVPGGVGSQAAFAATRVSYSISYPDDAPLVNESCAACGRSAVIEVELHPAEHPVVVARVCAAVPPAPAMLVPPKSPFPQPVWPGRFIAADSRTQGTWVGQYGSDG